METPLNDASWPSTPCSQDPFYATPWPGCIGLLPSHFGWGFAGFHVPAHVIALEWKRWGIDVVAGYPRDDRGLPGSWGSVLSAGTGWMEHAAVGDGGGASLLLMGWTDDVMRRMRGAWGSCYGRRSGWLWVVGSKDSVLPIVASAAGHGLIVMGCLASDGSWSSMVRGHGRWEIRVELAELDGVLGCCCWSAAMRLLPSPAAGSGGAADGGGSTRCRSFGWVRSVDRTLAGVAPDDSKLGNMEHRNLVLRWCSYNCTHAM
ncbi:hypothetical protein ACLOJK_021340 [Asimina triloba]